jgi:hypothetical protein
MSITDRLCQHYSQVGILPKEAARFSSLVSKWHHSNGTQWTVERLKSLGESYKSFLQHPESPYPIPIGWATRVNRKGQTVLRDGLAHAMMYGKSGKSLKISQAFFRSHQIFKLDGVTLKQLEKFVDGVTSPLPKTPECHDRLKVVSTLIRKSDSVRVIDPVDLPSASPLPYWSATVEKRSPVLELDQRSRLISIKSVPRTDIRTKEFVELLSSDTETSALWRRYPEEFSNILTGTNSLPIVSTLCTSNLPAGKIGFIQEGGAKLRAVANPCLALQALGEPLKVSLALLSQQHPMIFTFDQSQGQREIVKWLGTGRNVWSFDATAFTDRFPYALQLAALDVLILKGWATPFDRDVMNVMVSKDWSMPNEALSIGGPSLVSWKVGQPMGFGPSFHLATVTHMLVVEALASELDMNPYGKYVIVGDDIAICDSRLAESYSQFMASVGVEINMVKSMISNSFAEFCGKLITPQGVSESTKTKMVTSQDQLIRLLDFYGPKGFNYLSETEQSWALKAILPNDMGGLGFKPEGFTYAEYLSMLDLDKIQQRYLLHELDRFFDVPTKQLVEDSLQHLADFFDLNDLGIGQEEWARLLVNSDLALSEWTGLPAIPSSDQVNGDPDRGAKVSESLNTFRCTYDNAARQLLSKKMDHHATREVINQLQDIVEKVLDRTSGLIVNAEKSPLRPISTLMEDSDNDCKNQKSRERKLTGINFDFDTFEDIRGFSNEFVEKVRQVHAKRREEGYLKSKGREEEDPTP